MFNYALGSSLTNENTLWTTIVTANCQRFYALSILLLLCTLGLSCTKSTNTAEIGNNNESPSPAATTAQNIEQELEQRLKTISDRAQGTVRA